MIENLDLKSVCFLCPCKLAILNNVSDKALLPSGTKGLHYSPSPRATALWPEAGVHGPALCSVDASKPEKRPRLVGFVRFCGINPPTIAGPEATKVMSLNRDVEREKPNPVLTRSNVSVYPVFRRSAVQLLNRKQLLEQS